MALCPASETFKPFRFVFGQTHGNKRRLKTKIIEVYLYNTNVNLLMIEITI